ncbi:MAG: methionyl-tRNA formyltransferase [Bacteroidales bacterium]
MKRLRLVYMGTPEFAVAPMKAIIEEGFSVEAVVTVPDKPAGRGQKLSPSAVKVFAREKGLRVLQPVSLRDPSFINELKSINPDLIIVVAFRILPKEVYALPPLGTFNLHASLLPAYRGAAPIQRAVMNGESQTGLTTFLLDQGIDTGKILFQKPMTISPEETAGELHDRMMMESPEIVLATIRFLAEGKIYSHPQLKLVNAPQPPDASAYPSAPKILKSDCHIDWNRPVIEIFNQIRGLSPYPAAYIELQGPANESFHLKIYKASAALVELSELATILKQDYQPGDLICDGRKNLFIKALDGFLKILEVQLQGKKRLNIEEFLRGFKLEGQWKAL